MSGEAEAARRHRSFDLRWPSRRLRVTPDRRAVAPAALDGVAEGLDWDAFSTRFFPGRRRHDLEPISAYEAYMHDSGSGAEQCDGTAARVALASAGGRAPTPIAATGW